MADIDDLANAAQGPVASSRRAAPAFRPAQRPQARGHPKSNATLWVIVGLAVLVVFLTIGAIVLWATHEPVKPEPKAIGGGGGSILFD